MAGQPQPAATTTATPWPLSRIMMLVAFACFLIASLDAAGAFTLATAWAWGFGGFAAACLSWAIP